MRQGDLWRVSGLARDRAIVIVSTDAVNAGDQYPNVQGIQVVDSLAAPGHLLVVPITAPITGQALVADVSPVPKPRLAERLGAIPDDELDALRRGLSALFDL